MFRNKLGDPKPANLAELIETFDELDLNPKDCSAIISDYTDEEDDPYNGWCAEISGTDSEGTDVTLDTAAWKTQAALRNDLVAAGLTDITVD